MPQLPPPTDLVAIASRFQLSGQPLGVTRYGNGHLNHTYLVTAGTSERPAYYVLQQLNDVAFPQPVKLMENVQRVLAHLAEQPAADPRHRLTLVSTTADTPCHFDADKRCWRCYLHIPNAVGHDVVDTPEQAYEAAFAFGAFQRAIQDLPGPPLHETIPDFHHTPKRVRAFEAVLADDPLDRAADAAELIAFYAARAPNADRLLRQVEAGTLVMRPTHNDTKLNNVLLDRHSGRALCVIDLDTLMPGLPAYDFGDLVRSCTSTVPEDHPRADEVSLRLDIFEALAAGYLAGAGPSLSAADRDSLIDGGLLMTYECGLRFLGDHLAGDRYFRIHRPDHNLDRARTQAALLSQLEDHQKRLRQLVAKHC